jgi:hypothetical protein
VDSEILLSSNSAVRSSLRTFTFDSEGPRGQPKLSHCPETVRIESLPPCTLSTYSAAGS